MFFTFKIFVFFAILSGKKLQQEIVEGRGGWCTPPPCALSNQFFIRGSYKLKQNFKKNKVVTGKTPFFLIVHFVLIILFVLTLASDMAVLYENDAFPILELS